MNRTPRGPSAGPGPWSGLALHCSGMATGTVTDAFLDAVRARIPGSRLVHMKATGHCPNLSAPEETVAAIKAFL